MFVGDALRRDRRARVLLPDPRLWLDPEVAVRSVESVRALHPDLVLPGHGAPARRPIFPTTGA